MNTRSCLVAFVAVAALASHPVSAQVAVGGDRPLPDAQAIDAKGPNGQLNTLHDLYAALHGCVTPPALESAHRGMQVSVRFALNRDGKIVGQPRVTYSTPDVRKETRDIYVEAIMQSLVGCTPLPLSKGLANSIAGAPFNFRVVEDRYDPSEWRVSGPRPAP